MLCARFLPRRVQEFGPGCIVGAVDFYLQRPRAARALCVSPVLRVMCLSSSAFEQLSSRAPEALNLLQFVAMRSVCLNMSLALEVLEKNEQR